MEPPDVWGEVRATCGFLPKSTEVYDHGLFALIDSERPEEVSYLWWVDFLPCD